MGVPAVPTVEEIISKVLPGIPVAKGTVMAYIKGWTKTFYYDAITGKQVKFVEPPTVVAVAEVRGGKPPIVKAPTISIPTVPAIAPTSITVPSVTLPVAPTIAIPTAVLPTLPTIEVPVFTIPYLNLSFPYLTSDIGWVREGICAPINKIVEALYSFQSVVNDMIYYLNVGIDKTRKALLATIDSLKAFKDNVQSALNAYRDNIQSSINTALADTRDKMQSALNDYRSRIEAGVNTALADSIAKTQAALNIYRDNIQSSINAGLSDVIPKLYEQIGLPPDQLISTVQLRNVGTESFEFYAIPEMGVGPFGVPFVIKPMRLHYVAIGKR